MVGGCLGWSRFVSAVVWNNLGRSGVVWARFCMFWGGLGWSGLVSACCKVVWGGLASACYGAVWSAMGWYRVVWSSGVVWRGLGLFLLVFVRVVCGGLGMVWGGLG